MNTPTLPMPVTDAAQVADFITGYLGLDSDNKQRVIDAVTNRYPNGGTQ